MEILANEESTGALQDGEVTVVTGDVFALWSILAGNLRPWTPGMRGSRMSHLDKKAEQEVSIEVGQGKLAPEIKAGQK